jgi:thymidine phosphorylase
MNQPLASSVGNAVEVGECMAVLTGASTDGPLAELTVELCATVLQTCGAFPDIDAGRRAMRDALASGAAAERFGRMASALGAPADFVETFDRHLPQAPVIVDVPAGTGGTVTAIDGRAIGMAVVRMGGGRLKGGDPIDPAVGLSGMVRLGTKVAKGDPLARVHAADKAAAEAAAAAVAAAVTLGSGTPVDHTLVHRRLT